MDYLKGKNQNGLDYLEVLTGIASKLKMNIPLEELCNDLCEMISKIMRYSDIAVVRVQMGSILRMSPGFHTTQWGLVRDFSIEDQNSGRFEVYYTVEKEWAGGCPFIKEEENLLDNIVGLLSGAATKAAFKRLSAENIERCKELGGITRIISILKEDRPMELLLGDVCNAIPYAWQYPEHTGARITYGDLVFATENFSENQWIQKQVFTVAQGPSGSIEVCYTKEFCQCDEGPFLKEERNLIINLCQLLAAAAGSKLYERILTQNRERLKELNAINQTTQIINHGKSISDTLQNVCAILPKAMQYPEFTAARIAYGKNEYISRQFDDTPWILCEQFVTIDNKVGTIEVFYLREFPAADEGPFLEEERNLLRNIAALLAHFLNKYRGRILLEHSNPIIIDEHLHSQAVSNQQGDSLFLGKEKWRTDVSYVVREVLFIATPYEAYSVQSEGLSLKLKSDMFYSNCPRITVANTSELGVEYLSQKQFDLVIIMVGLDIKTAFKSYEEISRLFPSLPLNMFANRSSHIKPLLNTMMATVTGFKPVFFWNNDPTLIFALIKMQEDWCNVSHSYVPIVLLVEDDPETISKVISHIYRVIFQWVECCIKIQGRSIDIDTHLYVFPHLLVVSNFESAIHIVRQYQNRLCCVISDVEFDKNGNHNKHAGCDLIEIINELHKDIPCVLQSSESDHKKDASKLGCFFIEKSVPDYLDKIAGFVTVNLNNSILTLRNNAGNIMEQTNDICTIAKIVERTQTEIILKNLRDGAFEKMLRNQGELKSADEVVRLAQSDADDAAIHKQLIDLFRSIICQRFHGSVMKFDSVQFYDESFVTVLCGGSYGGKARGVAFLNSIAKDIISDLPFSGLKICTPVTAIIGTDEFENIMKRKSVSSVDLGEYSYDKIQKHFLEASLSDEVRDGLRTFISQIKSPIAVRSSSLFEDSLTQPFAGAFETYIIPNNGNDVERNLKHIETAVKLVFASLFRPEARAYFELAGTSLQEERMAVVIQELVGTDFDDYHYPHISGVAGSFNYYPVSHMKPEDGFVVIAFGLGVYVVEGRSGHRFSPAYPEISFGSNKDSLNNSQVKFYAVNLKKEETDLIHDGEKASLELLDIDEAEKKGTLKHCASVYDMGNDRIVPNLNIEGPRIVNFANILTFNYFPLADALKILLKKLSERMGTPVEIEFAVKLPHKKNNLKVPELYLLQVKPLVGEQLSRDIANIVVDPESVLLYSETALGNGVSDTISDVIMINTSKFDRTKTKSIAKEVEYFNRKLSKLKKQYLLIGPGRWGTRDESLGIPIVWSQICNAKVIVELGLTNYPLDASLGSHFFHNLTAMNIGYMAINENSITEIIKWDSFSKAVVVEQQSYVQHLQFSSSLHVEMDGKKRNAVVLWKGEK